MNPVIPVDAQQSENEGNEGVDQIPVWWAQQKKELSDRINKIEQVENENNAYLEQILRIVKGKKFLMEKNPLLRVSNLLK
ncbi:hypothetical protein V6N12_066186 [Hibiscus sabdariffa]|uniref:Uncharacterized protein n=1 Tax=Hibiscus sabdariffa TaxID=183260 RepID=A0ABR2B909_9ROSI